MEDNELRDIILEKSDEKRSVKIKKILMFVAMFFILFLIVLIAMKIINSDDTGTQSGANSDSRLVLPPEPEIVKDSKTGSDELFQQVPIIPENKGQDSFEEAVKSLKENKTQPTPEQPVVAPKEEPVPNVNELIKQQESKPEPAPVVNPEPKEQPKPTAKEQPKAPTKPVEQVKPAPKEQKPVVKPESKPAPKEQPKQPAKSASGGSYIQIVAVKNFNENSAEIKKIKAAGYSYKLHKAVVNGVEMTKVLVGPYSKDSIKDELSKVRANVASGAFIVNIK